MPSPNRPAGISRGLMPGITFLLVGAIFIPQVVGRSGDCQSEIIKGQRFRAYRLFAPQVRTYRRWRYGFAHPVRLRNPHRLLLAYRTFHCRQITVAKVLLSRPRDYEGKPCGKKKSRIFGLKLSNKRKTPTRCLVDDSLIICALDIMTDLSGALKWTRGCFRELRSVIRF